MFNTLDNASTNLFDVCNVLAPQRARVSHRLCLPAPVLSRCCNFSLLTFVSSKFHKTINLVPKPSTLDFQNHNLIFQTLSAPTVYFGFPQSPLSSYTVTPPTLFFYISTNTPHLLHVPPPPLYLQTLLFYPLHYYSIFTPAKL